MIKSIHIGRCVDDEKDYRALIEFFEAIGLEELAGREDRQGHTASFGAPQGQINVTWTAKRNKFRPSCNVDLLVEVSDPESVVRLIQKRGVRVLRDEVHPDSGARLVEVEAPGQTRVAIFGVEGGAAKDEALEGHLDATGRRFGIVVSRFNSFITERLLAGAMDALRRCGAKDSDIRLVRVPGAFEIPAAARALAETKKYDAVLCIGCLLRGDTLHYEVIANEVTRGIGQSAQETSVPHAFGVLTCDTLEQAIDRAGLKSGNKGFEAGLAAVEMASLRGVVSSPSSVVRKKARNRVGGKRPSARKKS